MNQKREELVEKAIAFTKGRMEESAGHDWMHIARVLANAEALAREEGADLLSCQLAAVMHDLINLPKNHPDRRQASRMSAREAAAWLEGRLDAERIEWIEEAIRCHSYSAGLIPEGLVAKVVSDADNLDALGAIGIARTFECGGAMGTATMAAEDPFCRKRTPTDHLYTVDHFYAKLLRLKERFYTESGRRAAERRLAFMEAFLVELEEETRRESESGPLSARPQGISAPPIPDVDRH